AFFEKSRALLLRQKLAGEQALLTTLSPESRKQEERLRGEEIYQKNLLAELEAEEASAAEIEQQRRLIFKAEDARRQFSQQLAANQPAFAHALQAYPTVTLEEVRKRLIRSDTTLLIEYFYNPEQGTLYLAGLTSNALYLSITALDAGEIGAFLGLLKNREINLQMETDHDFRWKFARQARLLYDALLKPVIPAQLPRELIIVPDGTLGAIPFDLLLPRDVDDHTDSFQTMPYLLRQTRVHFAASATLLLHASPLTEVQQATIGYLGFCPDYLPGGFFDVVHHGRPCVRRLAELFQGEFLSGSAATSADFLEQAAHTQILHFYGHAKAEDDRPEQSYLAFSSRTDRDKKATAGLIPAKPGKSLGPKSKLPADVVPDVIFAQQVSLMHLPAQLTVLSGCETGIGLTAGGEGIFSLARAFQEAGCPSTAMTLWTVDDEATAWLTTRFLQYIKNGAAKDEALRRAKLDFLASSATPAPYFWSGLVLSGDARPLTGLKTGSYLSLPDRRLPLIDVLMAVGLMLVIFGLLFAIFRHGSPSNRQI
ncbi:MAG: CHAT domain-containing protein, partial [Saprospiraceae bacterium]